MAANLTRNMNSISLSNVNVEGFSVSISICNSSIFYGTNIV